MKGTPLMPTVHVTNEVNRKSSVRYRNTSRDSLTFGGSNDKMDRIEAYEDIKRKFSAIHPPSHDLNNNIQTPPSSICINDTESTPDSYDLGYCSGLGSSPTASSPNHWKKSKGNDFINDSFVTPLKNLKQSFEKSFGPNKRLYDSSDRFLLFGKFKMQEAIPIIVICIIAFSSVVAVFTLSSALRNHDIARNSKYKSIEFGHAAKVKRQVDLEERGLGGPITDQEGELLGGKRASIQFAYDYNKEQGPSPVQEDSAEPGERKEATEGSNDIFNSLEIMEELQKMVKSRNQLLTPEAKRERLLKKIASFGHFSTSHVRPREEIKDQDIQEGGDDPKVQEVHGDPEEKEEQKEQEEKKIGLEAIEAVSTRQRRNSKSKNPMNKFRFHKLPIMKVDKVVKAEDDPFSGFR